MTITEPVQVDGDKLMQFVFKAVDEVGATLNAALVVMGDKLGYYRILADNGPLTADGLADKSGTATPYAREWLNAQAAGGYVTYDPSDGRYTLPPEQAVALTVEDSPAFLPGFFQIALGTVHDAAGVLTAARSGSRTVSRGDMRSMPPRLPTRRRVGSDATVPPAVRSNKHALR